VGALEVWWWVHRGGGAVQTVSQPTALCIVGRTKQSSACKAADGTCPRCRHKQISSQKWVRCFMFHKCWPDNGASTDRPACECVREGWGVGSNAVSCKRVRLCSHNLIHDDNAWVGTHTHTHTRLTIGRPRGTLPMASTITTQLLESQERGAVEGSGMQLTVCVRHRVMPTAAISASPTACLSDLRISHQLV
jgi:hypothetical protein